VDISLALGSFAGLFIAWIAIGMRRSRTPKLTIMDDAA
jgi:hypothetical protein